MKKLLILLLLITSNTFAQNPTKLKDFSTWSITPLFSTSYGNMDINNLALINTFNPGFDINVRKQLSYFTSIQATYSNTTLQAQNTKLKYTSYFNQLDARLCFNITNGFIMSDWKRTQLYAYFGYGILWYDATRNNLDHYEGTTRVIPMGMGAKYNVNKHLSFVLDINYNQSNTDRLDAYVNPLTAKDGYSKISLGVTYTFGKKKILEWDNPYQYLCTTVRDTIYSRDTIHSIDTIVVINNDIVEPVVVQKVVDVVPQKVINPDSLTIYYKYNSWTVSEITLAKIDKLVAKAKLTDSKILIESYCDTTGSDLGNLYLVTKRAGNIAYYIKNYYPSEKIIIKTYNESYSIEADDALNRKTIVKLIK